MNDKLINFLCVRAKNLKASIHKYEKALISPEYKAGCDFLENQLNVTKARLDEVEFMLSILSEYI